MTGAARQWEDWIAEQAAGIVRREMAPVETWESEGGSQPQRCCPPGMLLSEFLRHGLTECWFCGSARHHSEMVVSGLVPGKRRHCCMTCHQRHYPEDGRRRVPT